MSDLFGEESEVGNSETSKPAEVPTSNGHGLEEEPIPPRNGVASPSSSVNEVMLSDELPPGGEEEKERGSRDDIRVTVMGYQKAAEDYTFDVEVQWAGLVGINVCLYLPCSCSLAGGSE